ncbi:MAG TPA: hypothetical protein VNQ73_16655 [Ilumatobacter sp.]|nr:hypothetical protein [Ilumatobacter sp.]
MAHTTNRTGAETRGSEARRRSATEQHERAVNAINALFDRLDDLAAARQRLSEFASRAADGDPLRDADGLLQVAAQLAGAVDGVRAAALAAAEHRSRNELAADVGTRAASLFPRSAGPTRPSNETLSAAATTQRPTGQPSIGSVEGGEPVARAER